MSHDVRRYEYFRMTYPHFKLSIAIQLWYLRRRRVRYFLTLRWTLGNIFLYFVLASMSVFQNKVKQIIKIVLRNVTKINIIFQEDILIKSVGRNNIPIPQRDARFCEAIWNWGHGDDLCEQLFYCRSKGVYVSYKMSSDKIHTYMNKVHVCFLISTL